MNSLWTELMTRAGLRLSEQQDQQLSRYLDLLLEANTRMNLTRITQRSAAELQHVGDALTLLPFLPKGSHRLADVGSGGGVPGIPLAIVRPDAQVLLIEATKKKAVFLGEAAGALGLSNVTVVEYRAEEAGRSEWRETCDVAVCRAVGTMVWLIEWCLPLLKNGGKLLAMKGPKVVEELPAAHSALRLLHGSAPIIHPISLPETTGHVIVEIIKTAKIGDRYPRPATMAKGKPIQ